jgi:dephospho-CoA kinase
VIGLTGGIGSGKSAAASLFGKLGAPVIDADVIARQLVAADEPALAEIARTFGADVLTGAGELDRAALRRIVFADSTERSRLEAILHPRIREQIQNEINKVRAPYCIVVIPLLLETGQSDLVDRILVIDVPLATQISRVASRDRLPREEILAIIEAQVSPGTRLAAADDVIENSGGLDELATRVSQLHEKYLEIAPAQSGS